MKLVSVAQMKAIEGEADSKGWTYSKMMVSAGEGLAKIVALAGEKKQWSRVLGLVGRGNNGGDTLVALTWLAKSGWQTRAILVGREASGDPLIGDFLHAGGTLVIPNQTGESNPLWESLQDSNVLLDGLLGTGVKLPLREDIESLLISIKQAISDYKAPPFVVAVDCPSGVDCDTGDAAESTLSADMTVTMAAVKQGLLRFPANNFVGDLEVVDIGLPPNLESWNKITSEVADPEVISSILPRRSRDSHKGSFGAVYVLAGSTSFTGAALLAGEAAYRSGVGLVRMGIPEPLHPAISGQLPEAIWDLLPHVNGFLSVDARAIIEGALDRISAILVGPGLGTRATTGELVEAILPHIELPLVVDADGLRLLSRIPEWPSKIHGTAILTPHPGEMSALTGLPVESIQADRLEMAGKYASKWGHVIVLKGAFTVVAAPDGRTLTIPIATSALARAGTGDVLAGMITGLRAQGMEAFSAGVAGAYIHGKAGLSAEKMLGTATSVLARDVVREIGAVFEELENAEL